MSTAEPIPWRQLQTTGHLLKSDLAFGMRCDKVPHYFIYGERTREVDPGLCHVERVSDRNHLHGGHVVEHHHPHLHQLSFWLAGGVDYSIDGARHFLEGPTLVWMPAGVVHGFITPGSSECIVASLSNDFVHKTLHSIGHSLIQRQLRRPVILPVPDQIQMPLLSAFQRLEEEYRYPSWAQNM